MMKKSTAPSLDNGEKPSYIERLEAVFGPPSQEAFGSAVFFERIKGDDLEQACLDQYRFFVGDLWDEYGEQAWLSAWKEVYQREPGGRAEIVSELEGITDPDAGNSVPMFLSGIQDPQAAKQALAGAFDDPAVTDLKVFNIGDGGAMSGILIAGRRTRTAEGTFLFFLMD